MIRRGLDLSCALLLLCACGPGPAGDECDDAAAPPAAGAACAEDGRVCDPGADVCVEHVALACKDGRWQEQVVAAVECETGAPTTGMGTGTSGGEAVPCAGRLPPEGSACAMEGEDCSPEASACDPYTGATCTGGAWQYYHVGPGDPDACMDPVACDPQNIPAEGSACAMEGQFCSPGCEDPCSFCNVVTCEGGAWQGLEVFPAECLDCAAICEFVVPAACSEGPPELSDCVSGCEAVLAGDCRIPFHHTLACAGGAPNFGCDAMGRPVVAGCEQQFANLYMCTGL